MLCYSVGEPTWVSGGERAQLGEELGRIRTGCEGTDLLVFGPVRE